MMSGAHFVLHAAGWLESGLCTGYEKLVMDADRLGTYEKILAGLALDDEAMARDAYGEVEPAGHFLGCAHTMRNYENVFFASALSDSENVESWEGKGSKDMAERTFGRWNELLENYQAPPIDDAIDEALVEFVARRKLELPDAWY